MASQGDIAKFKARVSQLQRKRFQIMQYSEEPPRARLRGRIDGDRTRRKNASLSRFTVPGAIWEVREVWVDESGELHDEEADPAGGALSEEATPDVEADAETPAKSPT